jgi:hypothetical protein
MRWRAGFGYAASVVLGIVVLAAAGTILQRSMGPLNYVIPQRQLAIDVLTAAHNERARLARSDGRTCPANGTRYTEMEDCAAWASAEEEAPWWWPPDLRRWRLCSLEPDAAQYLAGCQDGFFWDLILATTIVVAVSELLVIPVLIAVNSRKRLWQLWGRQIERLERADRWAEAVAAAERALTAQHRLTARQAVVRAALDQLLLLPLAAIVREYLG